MRRGKSLTVITLTAIIALAGAVWDKYGGTIGRAPGLVTRVVDGDTLVVTTKTGEEKVRLLGINTPEKEGPFTHYQPFSLEATKRAKELALHKSVTLTSGGKNPRDKYGRLLAYVTLPDGEDMNAILIQEGLAEHYRKFSHARKEQYRELENTARNACRGMWMEREPSCKNR